MITHWSIHFKWILTLNWFSFGVKGRSDDICSRDPCFNKGVCTQISQSPGYRCKCEGTGFWGTRCQRKCPTFEDGVYQGHWSHECIVIWANANKYPNGLFIKSIISIFNLMVFTSFLILIFNLSFLLIKTHFISTN